MALRKRLRRRQRYERMEAVRGTGTDPAVLAAAASVVLSWAFFARGKRHAGLFVGLWAPTILAFASYFKQTRMNRRLTRSSLVGDVADALGRLAEGRAERERGER